MLNSQTFFRYFVSGITATAVNVFILFFLTSVLYVWYIFSSSIAFCLAFLVSFSLQKLWTFQDNSVHELRKQMFFYFVIALFNLGINAFFMYILVEYSHVHYLLAQIISAGIIALESFFVYRLIFKKSEVVY